jgi:hypothetical protein
LNERIEQQRNKNDDLLKEISREKDNNFKLRVDYEKKLTLAYK